MAETAETPNLAEQLTECLDILADDVFAATDSAEAYIKEFAEGEESAADIAASLQPELDKIAEDPVFTAKWQVIELVQTLLAEHLEVTTLLGVAIERERSRQATSAILTASMADLEALKAPLGKVKA